MGVIDLFSDWIVYVATGATSLVLGWGGRVEGKIGAHDDRLEDIERRLEGDEGDPSSPGALRTIHKLDHKVDDLDTKVDELEEQIEANRQERKREHRAVLERLEDLRGE